MKIFVSSLISGFEHFRFAARAAIESLGHEPVMAEDFNSQPNSPQIACLQGLRSADLVVLLLGERYGTAQGSSGIAPTHEEFVEARGRKPILLFVQEDISPEPNQKKLITDAQGWEGGLFREGFRSSDDLRVCITRAIHRYEVAHAAAPVDTPGLIAAAERMLANPLPRAFQGSQLLRLAIAMGPRTRALRPAQLEAVELSDTIQQHATFGASFRLFEKTAGVESRVEGEALLLTQENGNAIRLTECGDIELRLQLERGGKQSRSSVPMGIIEESVLRELTHGVEFTNWLLDKIDPTQRLTNLAIGAMIEASDYLGWRTQAEQDASPNAGSMRMSASPSKPVTTDRPRAALKFDARTIAEDLMVPLRRLWRA